MASAFFCAFITLPTVIEKPGQYVTRGGEVVTIDAVSSRHDFNCKGRYSDGIRDGWHKSGRLYFGTLSQNDIVRAA